MKKETRLLTIGRFAAMHGINKKTLMWYDEIGLFRPAFVHPENGYRFYSYQQSPVLETILLLRELDVSIDEIQDFMQNRSAESLKCLLEAKLTDLNLQITHLQAVRSTLCTYQRNLDSLLTMDLSKISVIEKEPRCLITIEIDKDISYEESVELVTAETEKYHLGRLHDASYGSMISVSSLLNGHYDDYTRLFIEIPFLTNKTDLHLPPVGTYLQAFHQGVFENLPMKYEEIFAYARKRGLTLYEYSYEMGINENVIDRIEDYIVQIEIPVLT